MDVFGTEGAEGAVAAAASDEQALLVLLMLGIPLAGFLVTGAVGRRPGARAGTIAVGGVLASAALATILAYGSLSGAYGEHGIGFTLYTWIGAGDLAVEFGFLVDNLTAVLLIVVTWIGAPGHVRRLRYM